METLRRLALYFIISLLVTSCTKEAERISYQDNSTDSVVQQKIDNCVEPENPYSQGTGRYAGWVWAESNSSAGCNGNSQSFNNGCENFHEQQEKFEECRSQR